MVVSYSKVQAWKIKRCEVDTATRREEDTVTFKTLLSLFVYTDV